MTVNALGCVGWLIMFAECLNKMLSKSKKLLKCSST